MACAILVPQPGTELKPPALEAKSLNPWTAREAQVSPFKGEAFLIKARRTVPSLYYNLQSVEELLQYSDAWTPAPQFFI